MTVKSIIIAVLVLVASPAFAQVSDQEKVQQIINEQYANIPQVWCDASTTAMVRETMLALVREQGLPSIKEEYPRRIQQLTICSNKMADLRNRTRSDLAQMVYKKDFQVMLEFYYRITDFLEDINSTISLYGSQSSVLRYEKLVDRYNGLVDRYNDLGNRLARVQSAPAPSYISKQSPLHCTASTNPFTHVTDMDCE